MPSRMKRVNDVLLYKNDFTSLQKLLLSRKGQARSLRSVVRRFVPGIFSPSKETSSLLPRNFKAEINRSLYCECDLSESGAADSPDSK